MITIRKEHAKDIPAVRHIHELAFSRPNEALLVEALRTSPDPKVSLVAEVDGRVIGHIFFSRVEIGSSFDSTPSLGLAPMAVLPEFQRQGFGSRLVRDGLTECRRIGCLVVVVLGHPNFYPRFGFVPAQEKGLHCEYPATEGSFLVNELVPGALAGRSGLIKYRPEFSEV